MVKDNIRFMFGIITGSGAADIFCLPFYLLLFFLAKQRTVFEFQYLLILFNMHTFLNMYPQKSAPNINSSIILYFFGLTIYMHYLKFIDPINLDLCWTSSVITKKFYVSQVWIEKFWLKMKKFEPSHCTFVGQHYVIYKRLTDQNRDLESYL